MILVSDIETYEREISEHPLVLTYVTGTNCGVCSAVKPKVLRMVEELGVRALEINTHEHQELAAQLSVFTIPALLVHARGRESIREARYFSFDELERRISRLQELLEP